MGLEGTPPAGATTPWEGCRSKSGASLPPRKRLLAGLKQNGWLSIPSSSSSSPTVPSVASHPPEELKVEVVDLDGAKLVLEAKKADDSQQCLKSGAESGNAIQEIEILDVGKHLDYGKSKTEPKLSISPTFASTSVVHAEIKPATSKQTRNCQPRFQMNESSENVNVVSTSDSGVSKRQAVSPDEIVEAAKSAAAKAAKTAADARATATAKAEAAAKAAAVARAALDAVALLAREEARNLHRKSSRARFRATKRNKTMDTQKRAELGVSQMSTVVDDEELARQLHRAINSSPRILRSSSLQHPKTGKFIVATPVTESVNGSSRLLTIQEKNRPVRQKSSALKDGGKQEVQMARQNSRRLQSRSKRIEVESQSTSELSKSTNVDFADTVSSFLRSGLSSTNHTGEMTTDHLQLENEDTLNRRAVNVWSQDGQLDMNTDINKTCNIVRPTLLESTREISDIRTCKHVNNLQKINIDVKLPELGKGDNEVEMEEMFADKCLDKMLPGLDKCGKLPDMFHNAEDLKKKSGTSMKKLSVVMDKTCMAVPPAAEGGKQAGKLWGMESWIETDADDILKPTESTMEDRQQVCNFEGNCNTGSGMEGPTVERKHSDEATDSGLNNRRHLGKYRSFRNRSNTLQKNLSDSIHGRTGVPSWNKSMVKGISSGARSFKGINVVPFGSAPSLPLCTPAFVSGPTTRHS